MKQLSILIFMFLLSFPTITQADSCIDYSKPENWVRIDQNIDKDIDIFYIAPTVGPKEDTENLKFTETNKLARFRGTINMVRGIYEDTGRIYAPYYRQAALGTYYMNTKEAKPHFDLAFKDVHKAFKYYLKHYNNGRPIIVGGFSQGGQHSIRLLKKYVSKRKFREQFIAGYSIGWRLTDADLKHHKYLKPAQGETDTGVIITFNSEALFVEETFICPKNVKNHCINPLNWSTDSKPASKNLNLGACFTDFDANILKEIPKFTGAYIDEKRGVLKLFDLDAKAYPDGDFSDGIYHRYENNLYYRNLQQNVAKRTQAFLKNTRKKQ